MISFPLNLAGPFDPELSLAFWLRHPMEKVDLVRNGTYTRLFFRGERPVLMQISPEGSLDDPKLELTLRGEIEPGDREWAEETARWILHDHLPLEEFYSHISSADPTLAPLTRRFRGLRPPLSPTLFETLVFAIVGQQVNLSFAYKCKAALEEHHARRASIDGEEYFAALAPEDLEGAEIAELRALKISNNKSRAILELAESLRVEPLDRHSLRCRSNDEIHETLISFRGIGPWTAEYAMIRALGILDVLPGGDTGLQNALKRCLGLEEKPTEEEVRAIGERWGPYKALVTFYLWTNLMHEEREKKRKQ